MNKRDRDRMHDDLNCRKRFVDGPEWTTEAAFDLLEYADRLEAEIARLKAGDLTPEEFQNLCHNLHQKTPPCTRDEFEAGCRACADSIFGPKESP